MIVDHLSNHAAYQVIHPLFAEAFEFLSRKDLSSLPAGKVEINGEQLFAIFDHASGKGQSHAMLVFHQRYIDIQYVSQGYDMIGWKLAKDCQRVSQELNPEKDLGFYFDRPETWLHIPENFFAIFFPHDAHAPLGCNGEVSKAVIKVACDV